MAKLYFDKTVKEFFSWWIVSTNDGKHFRGELFLTNRERVTTNTYDSIEEVELDIANRN